MHEFLDQAVREQVEIGALIESLHLHVGLIGFNLCNDVTDFDMEMEAIVARIREKGSILPVPEGAEGTCDPD